MVRFLRLPWRGATAISGYYVPSIIRSNRVLPLGKNKKKTAKKWRSFAKKWPKTDFLAIDLA